MQPLATETYDLRTARVQVDMLRGTVRVKDGERECRLALHAIPRWREFVRVLLLAALSTHPPVALPHDELDS